MTDQKRTAVEKDTNAAPSKLFPFEIGVRRTIEINRLIEPGDHLLVALSGGADSVALLHCLRRLPPEWNLVLTAAHLNHGMRGDEDREDSEFVRELSVTLEVNLIEESIEVTRLKTPKNLEERARKVRYDFLERAAQEAGADSIAVGHNRDDQAETVLLRLLRGSGITGLSAIRPKTGRLIRPLLEMPRREILKYLESLGVPFREDSSNRSLRYRRNRVRQELIPYLEAWFNPAVTETLARHAAMAQEVSDFLELESKQAYESMREVLPRGISIPISRIGPLPAAMKKLVLRKGLKEVRGALRGITARHVEDTLRLCRSTSGRYIQLPGGLIAMRQFDSLLLVRRESQEDSSFEYVLAVPGRCKVPEAALEFTALIADPGSAAARRPAWARALLDPKNLPDELRIRSRRPGDRYGGPGKRKVKRILIDGKVPLADRSRLPLVTAGGTVIWIPGFDPVKSFIANPLSGRCVILEVHRDSAKGSDI